MYNVIRKTGGGLAVENFEAVVGEFTSTVKLMAADVRELKEAMSKFCGVESDSKRLLEGQRRLGEYVT